MTKGVRPNDGRQVDMDTEKHIWTRHRKFVTRFPARNPVSGSNFFLLLKSSVI